METNKMVRKKNCCFWVPFFCVSEIVGIYSVGEKKTKRFKFTNYNLLRNENEEDYWKCGEHQRPKPVACYPEYHR